VRFDIHVSTGARQPRASGGTQTTPKRDTVAGDATAQSSTYRSNEDYMFETHAVTEQKSPDESGYWSPQKAFASFSH